MLLTARLLFLWVENFTPENAVTLIGTSTCVAFRDTHEERLLVDVASQKT